MSVTLYTVARADSGGRFAVIGQLMAAKSFTNRLVQDGVRLEDAGSLATDAARAALRAHHDGAICTHGDTFTRELSRSRYRVVATIVTAPEIAQDN